MDFFNRDQMIDDGAPEYFVTRTGYMEMLPGPCIRYYMVIDHPIGGDGMPGACECRAKFVMPAETFLAARMLTTAWLAHQGLHLPVGSNWCRPPPLTM